MDIDVNMFLWYIRINYIFAVFIIFIYIKFIIYINSVLFIKKTMLDMSGIVPPAYLKKFKCNFLNMCMIDQYKICPHI